MKVVINTCYGGFALSPKGIAAVRKRKGCSGSRKINDYTIPRDDPDLVAVVEEMGEKANGVCAKLKIVEIPDRTKWEIDEYDGLEEVHEKHQSWS